MLNILARNNSNLFVVVDFIAKIAVEKCFQLCFGRNQNSSTPFPLSFLGSLLCASYLRVRNCRSLQPQNFTNHHCLTSININCNVMLSCSIHLELSEHKTDVWYQKLGNIFQRCNRIGISQSQL